MFRSIPFINFINFYKTNFLYKLIAGGSASKPILPIEVDFFLLLVYN